MNASLATEDPKTAKSPLEQAATAAALNAADRRDVPFELVEFCGQYVGNTDNGESALISCQQTDDLFQTPELQTPELDFRNRLRVGNVVAFQIVKGREKGSVQFKRGSTRPTVFILHWTTAILAQAHPAQAFPFLSLGQQLVLV